MDITPSSDALPDIVRRFGGELMVIVDTGFAEGDLLVRARQQLAWIMEVEPPDVSNELFIQVLEALQQAGGSYNGWVSGLLEELAAPANAMPTFAP